MLMVMENLDLTQVVNDRRAEREADAEEHRIATPEDKPEPGQPRLRYVRKHRNETAPRHSHA